MKAISDRPGDRESFGQPGERHDRKSPKWPYCVGIRRCIESNGPIDASPARCVISQWMGFVNRVAVPG